ncbi:cell wall metabolism sensor histidine kinase WalK [Agrococcus sp. TF02-05]|uniref:sensor histidine kinase n=1 Tax=Agrococcus sp. TF02-05 TaxID=2815211 RepID=UPI001AA1D476|nr:ATP-binding protein [Agrococcus sp. TF02-05]MBO1769577.1 two-component sensor histidine kinase [Agrococcus sp. TF02-05]
MDASWYVLLALLLGFGLGSLSVHLLGVAAQRGRQVMAIASEPIPDGIAAMVDVLESAGVVLDGSNQVLLSSPGAVTLDLVDGRALRSHDILEAVRRVWRTGREEVLDLVHRRGRIGAGTELHLRVRVAPLGNRFMLVLAADRTEELRLAGVRRDFVANVSHELKTPIGAVAVLAEAIEAAADDPDRVRAFAQRMQVESDRLGRMTKELIDLSRIQADDPLDQPERVGITDVVDVAVDRTRVLADAKRMRVVTRVLEDAEVLGSAELITMAVQNLVANAVQYSPEATHVGIGVRVVDGVVEIAVTDKGVGIAPEDRERVFERFYRVDPARSRVTGGTGLGLSIVKHVAVSHGGEVTLWSRPGQGSTFTLRLPVAETPAREETA